MSGERRLVTLHSFPTLSSWLTCYYFHGMIIKRVEKTIWSKVAVVKFKSRAYGKGARENENDRQIEMEWAGWKEIPDGELPHIHSLRNSQTQTIFLSVSVGFEIQALWHMRWEKFRVSKGGGWKDEDGQAWNWVTVDFDQRLSPFVTILPFSFSILSHLSLSLLFLHSTILSASFTVHSVEKEKYVTGVHFNSSISSAKGRKEDRTFDHLENSGRIALCLCPVSPSVAHSCVQSIVSVCVFPPFRLMSSPFTMTTLTTTEWKKSFSISLCLVFRLLTALSTRHLSLLSRFIWWQEDTSQWKRKLEATKGKERNWSVPI